MAERKGMGERVPGGGEGTGACRTPGRSGTGGRPDGTEGTEVTEKPEVTEKTGLPNRTGLPEKMEGPDGMASEHRRVLPDGGEAADRWHRNVIGVLLPTIAVGALFAGIVLLALVDPLFSESVNDTLVTILAYLFLILTALAIGIAPYSFHRDKSRISSSTGWRPSDLYYLLFVPGLNVVLAGIYLYQRNSAIASPAKGGGTHAAKATEPVDTAVDSRDGIGTDEDRPDLPAELDYQSFLRHAIPYGFAAWLLGVLTTVIAVGLSDDPVFNPGNPFSDGIFWYITFHGFVRIYSRTDDLWFVSGDAIVLIFGSVAAFPLLLFGALAVRRSALVPASISQGTVAGACITAGYAIPMLVMSAIVELDISPAIDPETGFLLGYSNTVLQIDPISGLLSGLLFGVVFGGLGGLTARMRGGKYLLGILLALFGLLNLFIIAVFASGPS